MTDLKHILSNMYVSDIIKDQKLVSVLGGDSVRAVAGLLSKHDISSVPIFKNSKMSIDNCLGIADFSDIAQVILGLQKKGYSDHDPRKNIWAQVNTMSVEKAIQFNNAKYVQVKMTSPILDVVENCAEFAFRRMLAVDDEGIVKGVVSPSELFTQILEAVGQEKEKVLDMTLGELNVGSLEVFSCEKRDKVGDALEKMAEKLVTALAVVDHSTKALCANVSVSDVSMLIEKESAADMRKNVWKFITEMKDKEIDAVYPYFSVTEESTLRKTIERILATKVHHLYIVDAQNVPLKVVGFSDLCRGLLAFNRLE